MVHYLRGATAAALLIGIALSPLPIGGQIQAGLVNLATMVTGVMPVANGGSNKALTLAAGGLVWTDADSFEVGAAGTAGRAAISGGTGAPTWFAPAAGLLLFTGANGILATDSVMSVDSANDYVGVGIATALAPLHVLHTGVTGYSSYTNLAGSAGAAGQINRFNVDDTTFTAPSVALFDAALIEMNLTPAVNASRATNAMHGIVLIPGSNSTVLTDYTSSGIYASAEYAGTGTFGALRGSTVLALTSGSGTGTNVVGQNVTVGKVGTGPIGILSGIAINNLNLNATGTITQSAHIALGGLVNSGTITNTYGVYVGTMTAGTQTNTPYSFYASDPLAKNHFAGLITSGAYAPGSGQNPTRLQIGDVLDNGTAGTAYSSAYLDLQIRETDFASYVTGITTLNLGMQYGYAGAASIGTASPLNLWHVIAGSGSVNNEMAGIINILNMNIGTGYTQTAGPTGRLWLVDEQVHGPLAVQPGTLNGPVTQVNNYYNGSPSASPSAGTWVTTIPNVGNTDAAHLAANTYAVNVGLGIVGYSRASAVDGVGFTTGLQIGGFGSPWNESKSIIGTGINISQITTTLIAMSATEATDAVISIAADEADDATDTWLLKVTAAAGSVTWTNNSNLRASLTTAGNYDAVTFSAAGDSGHTGSVCSAFTGGLCTTGTEPLASPVALALLPRLDALEAELTSLRAELAALKGVR